MFWNEVRRYRKTYKIYSKSVFNKIVEIDSNVDKILSDIDNDFKNATNEAKEENMEEEEIKPEPVVIGRLMGNIYKSNYEDNNQIDIINDMPLMSVVEVEEKPDEEENRD